MTSKWDACLSACHALSDNPRITVTYAHDAHHGILLTITMPGDDSDIDLTPEEANAIRHLLNVPECTLSTSLFRGERLIEFCVTL